MRTAPVFANRGADAARRSPLRLLAVSGARTSPARMRRWSQSHRTRGGAALRTIPTIGAGIGIERASRLDDGGAERAQFERVRFSDDRVHCERSSPRDRVVPARSCAPIRARRSARDSDHRNSARIRSAASAPCVPAMTKRQPARAVAFDRVDAAARARGWRAAFRCARAARCGRPRAVSQDARRFFAHRRAGIAAVAGAHFDLRDTDDRAASRLRKSAHAAAT